MNQILTPDQIRDLAAIRKICDEMGADAVVIGATALLLSIGDIGRFTRDVDLTVALDLNEFSQLIQRLLATGWKQSSKLEHRWVAPRQTIVDLLPAGPALRRSGSVLWSTSQFRMSLSGFDHVFASAIDVDLSADTSIRVAPVSVTALLKMIAYMEDPHRRSKDLQDIEIILGWLARLQDENLPTPDSCAADGIQRALARHVTSEHNGVQLAMSAAELW